MQQMILTKVINMIVEVNNILTTREHMLICPVYVIKSNE